MPTWAPKPTKSCPGTSGEVEPGPPGQGLCAQACVATRRTPAARPVRRPHARIVFSIPRTRRSCVHAAGYDRGRARAIERRDVSATCGAEGTGDGEIFSPRRHQLVARPACLAMANGRLWLRTDSRGFLPMCRLFPQKRTSAQSPDWPATLKIRPNWRDFSALAHIGFVGV